MGVSKFIQAGSDRLHYVEWGSGPRLLLAFHGYGDDAGIFDLLKGHELDEFTVACVDLPYHGRSEWRTDARFDAHHLRQLVKGFAALCNVNKVTLLGYSMGGRICLSILDVEPSMVENMVLLASDGLELNRYYRFFMKTAIGRRIFHRMLDRPDAYISLVEWMKRSGLVSTSRYKFAMHFLGSEDSRRFLQKVWPCTSDLVPAPARLRALIKRHRTPVTIFMGEHDKIIAPRLAKRFARELDTVRVIVLDKGHRVFDESTAHLIAERLK